MPENPYQPVTHTPGPWMMTGESSHGFYFKVRGTRLGQKWKICDCEYTPGVPVEQQEAEANARLIAAAPELLAALQSLLAIAEDEQKAGHGTLETARAAIARATALANPGNAMSVPPHSGRPAPGTAMIGAPPRFKRTTATPADPALLPLPGDDAAAVKVGVVGDPTPPRPVPVILSDATPYRCPNCGRPRAHAVEACQACGSETPAQREEAA